MPKDSAKSLRTADKSQLWADLLKSIETDLGSVPRDNSDILHYITRNGCYTFPRETADPRFDQIAGDYLAWLDENGTPLSSFPNDVEESSLVHPDLVTSREGRKVSTMFLFHLCIAQRLAPFLGKRARIIEIGGGYGGLARVAKLIWPRCRYTIVDIPQSLFFSGLFLQENFPDAGTERTPQDGQPFTVKGVEFVAADEVEKIFGRAFDVVINTCSFGEMVQETVNSYLDIIENRIRSKYVYSINRFGNRPFGDLEYQAPRDAGPGTADMAFFLGPHWDVLVWDCWNEAGFSEIEIAAAPYLEILLQRRRPFHYTKRQRMEKAIALRHAARNLAPGSSDWHYCLFNSIRYFPLKSVVEKYARHLRDNEWPEADFFERLEATAAGGNDITFQGSRGGKTAVRLASQLGFTRLNRAHHRRIHGLATGILTPLGSDRDRLERRAKSLESALEDLDKQRGKELAHAERLAGQIERLKAELEELRNRNS